jgi:hypothetical protein
MQLKQGAKEGLQAVGESLLRIVLSTLLGLGMTFVFAEAQQHGAKLFFYLGRLLGVRGAQVVLIVCVCVTGWFAHEYKRRQQIRYGMLEVLFGVVSAVSVGFSMIPGNSTLTQWVALVGSGYVIARGLNNVSDGRTEKLRIEAILLSQKAVAV